MARPVGSKNVKKEVEQDVQEAKKGSVTLEVVDESLASDKTTTVRGINEGKQPKYDRTSF